MYAAQKTQIAGRRRAAARIRARKRNQRTAGYLGIEKKFYDTSLAMTALTAPSDASGGEHNPSATIALNTVVQGDGESNRDGKQITMKSLYLKGVIDVQSQVNQTVPENATEVMIAIVLDTQTNGAILASENVFTNPSASTPLAPQVFRNLKYSKRFQVLKRIQMTLPQPVAVWDGTNIEQYGYQIPWECYIDLDKLGKNSIVNYSNTTETIANITDNSINLIAYANNTSTAPRISYNARLRFVG